MTATIGNIKDKLTELIGEDIVITVEAGRKKTTTHVGRLTETYPAVFVVELNDCKDSYERVSYSYADVLTNSINIDFPDEELASTFNEDLEELIEE